jgi:hypothetical protein
VNFRQFMSDRQAIKGDSGELKELIEKEWQEAHDFLEKSHKDIITNFDPKVVKLRKRRKIIISDAAAKDLL